MSQKIYRVTRRIHFNPCAFTRIKSAHLDYQIHNVHSKGNHTMTKGMGMYEQSLTVTVNNANGMWIDAVNGEIVIEDVLITHEEEAYLNILMGGKHDKCMWIVRDNDGMGDQLHIILAAFEYFEVL